MRRLGLVAIALLLAGCDSGHDDSSGSAKALSAAAARTIAAHSARIAGHDTVDSGDVHGTTEHTTGVVALDAERGHITADGSEQIVDGPVEYQYLFPGTKQPWARRSLAADDVTTLHHLQFMLYLASGSTDVHDRGEDGNGVRRIRARIDPARVRSDLPPWLSPTRRFLLANDYAGQPFDADFWIDRAGRLNRIEAHLKNAPFGKDRANVTLALRLSDFGTHVDVTPPPASQIQDG